MGSGSENLNKILEQLGLQKYSETFKENGISYDALLLLSKEDLQSLIPVLGHRIQLWSVIEKMNTGAVFKCFCCPHNFSNLNDLNQHLKNVHSLRRDSIYKCYHCSSSFERKSFLNHFRNIFKLHKSIFITRNDTNHQSFPVLEASPIPLETTNTTIVKPSVYTINKDKATSMISKLLASMMKSGKVPMSTSDTIFSTVRDLVSEVIREIKLFVLSLLDSSLNLTMQVALDEINVFNNIFTQFDSKYKLNKYLIKNKLMVEPKEIVLDTDIVFRTNKEERQQVYRPIKMQYVPIRSTIEQLLNKSGFFESLQLSKSYNGVTFNGFREGGFVRDQNYPKNSIFICIYYDDAEMANPLGSKSGRHKVANFYFSILDMPSHLLSSVDNIMLLASLKTDDLKAASVNAVVGVFVKELVDLWENGIDFIHNGEKTNLKVVMAQFAGDNFGIHTILGFTEGFAPNFPCRRCKSHKKECQKDLTENKQTLRNVFNFNQDVLTANLSTTGLSFDSILNKLPYFHITENFVFDTMHDILVGCGPDLFLLCLNSWIKKKHLTLNKFNYRLESFDYGRHFSKSRPSSIKLSYLKGESKAGQSASQMLNLLLYLPLLCGDLIPKDDSVWSLFLLFNDILKIILSSEISLGGILQLDSFISEFLHCYKKQFCKNLKPKHHHLLHYASSIEKIGPLRQFWSMTFEAKHKFFKTNAHTTCNFKNISKSLSYRHQLSRCFYLMSKESFSQNSFETTHYDHISVNEIENSLAVQERLSVRQDSIIKVTDQVIFNGNDFRIGSFVLLKYCSQYPKFGQIRAILLENDECNLVMLEYDGEYDDHFASFKLNKCTNYFILDINEIKYHLPMYTSESFLLNDISIYLVLPTKIL